MHQISTRIIAAFAVLVASFGAGAPALAGADDDLRPVELTLEASRRIGRTTFEYDYRVTISNSAATAYENVIGQAASNDTATTVISSPLRFGSIAGSGRTSAAPLTVRKERTSPINTNAFEWAFSGDAQQTANGTVDIVAVFAPEPEAPLSGGTFAEIGGARVELGEDGAGSISLTPGDYAIKVIEPFQSSGSASATVRSGETTLVRVELQRGFEQIDDASLEIVSPASGILAAGRAFEIAARRAGGVDATLTRLDYLLISPVFRGDDPDSFSPSFLGPMNNLTEEFEIRNGRIAAKNPSALVEFLKTLPNGGLLIEAGASNETAGVFYEAELVAYLGQYRLAGTVRRPVGAPTFPLVGAKLRAALLGTDRVVETTLDAAGGFVFDALPNGTVGLSAEIESLGLFYTVNEVVELEADTNAALVLQGPPTLAAVSRRSKRAAAATPEEAERLANLVFANTPFSDRKVVAVTGAAGVEVTRTLHLTLPADAPTADVAIQLASGEAANFIEEIFDPREPEEGPSFEEDTWTVNVRTLGGRDMAKSQGAISSQRRETPRWPLIGWGSEVDIDNDQIRDPSDPDDEGCEDNEGDEDDRPPNVILIDCIYYAYSELGILQIDLSGVRPTNGMKELVIEVSVKNVGDVLLDTLIIAGIIGGEPFFIQPTGEISTVPSVKGKPATDRRVISVPDNVNRENVFDRSIQFEIVSNPDRPVNRRDLVAAKSFALVGGREVEMLTDVSKLLPDLNDARFWLPVQFKSDITTPSPFGDTPESSNIAFRIEASTQDGREGTGSVDNLTALWHMKSYQVEDERYSIRDRGFDDWSSEEMFYWLQTRQPDLTKSRINDVSGEFGRDIGHKSHGLGNDVDVFLFGDELSRNSARDNYQAAQALAVDAAFGDEQAKARLAGWIAQQRQALRALQDDASVVRVYGPKGQNSAPLAILPDGWLESLIRFGRVRLQPVSSNPAPGELVIGGALSDVPLRSSKYVARQDHNDHYHISLN